MQTPKDYTRKLLLKTAREAFLQKGYKAVSMREISKLSGVGLSNIYNYYPCKEDLLAVVLHPLLEAMNGMLDNHNRDESLSLEIFTSEEYHRKTMQIKHSISSWESSSCSTTSFIIFIHQEQVKCIKNGEIWVCKSG